MAGKGKAKRKAKRAAKKASKNSNKSGGGSSKSGIGSKAVSFAKKTLGGIAGRTGMGMAAKGGSAIAKAASNAIAANKAKKAGQTAAVTSTASKVSTGAKNLSSTYGKTTGSVAGPSKSGGSSKSKQGGGSSGGSSSSRNLYELYKSKGQALPSISERAKEFEARGLGPAGSYAGTAEQNTRLLNSMSGGKTVATPAVQSSDLAYNAATDAMSTLDTVSQLPPVEPIDVLPPTPLDETTATDDPFQSQIQEFEKAAEDEVKAADRIFKNLERNLDASSRQLITAINNSYNSRLNEQRAINSAATSAERVAGIVSGRARYASEIQTGILSAQESEGIKKLSSLSSEEAQLIAEARSDAEAKRVDLMTEKMSQYKIIQDRKRDLINDLYKNTIDYENLLISKAEEKRNAIKDNLANQVSMSNAIAGSLMLELGNMDLASDEAKAIINARAMETGVSPSVLIGSIRQYQTDQSKELPSIAQEYEYAKTQGYSGGFFDYMAKKKSATTIATSGGSTIDAGDAERWGLPTSLIGRNERDIILDLSSSNVPSWFGDFLKSQGIPVSSVMAPEEIQRQWDQFRNNSDLAVFKNTIDVLKGTSGEAQGTLLGGSSGGFNFELSDDVLNQALSTSGL